MIKVNAMGDACPIPVVKTKNAIRDLGGAGIVETLVDNEIAVQNLSKMAKQKGYECKSEKLEEAKFKVTMTIGDASELPTENEETNCLPLQTGKKKVVVAIGTDHMGQGNDELGKILMKSFIYALSQQDELPSAVIFYNGGVHITCEESPMIDDLKSMEAMGCEIISCGTCLDFYDLKDKLLLGEISNMYSIVETLTQADLVVRP